MENNESRLFQLIKELKFSQLAFSKVINVSQSYLNKVASGQAEISRGMLEKILEKFPQVNITWLLSGNGAMFATLQGDSIASDVSPGQRENPIIAIHPIGDELHLKGILVDNLKTAASRWDLYNQQLFALLDPSVGRQGVSKYMLGHTLPNLPALVRFEWVTGIPLSVLLTQRISAEDLPAAPIEPGDRTAVALMMDLKRAQVGLEAFIGKK